MTLEELARQRGVLLSDRTTPCRAKNHFPDLSLLGSNRESGQCVVYILGAEINTASFAMYTFSISVLVQALLIISMSGAADHGRFRKMFLLACAFTGSIATMLFLPVVPKVYLIGALLAIIANTCFGASFVLLNSFLPLLVRHHPTVQREDPESSSDDLSQGERSQSHASSRNDHGVIPEASENTALLGPHSEAQTSTPYAIPAIATMDELALSTKISSYGIGIGYIAAVIVQCFSIVILILRHNSSDALRIVLFVIGAWWFIFTIPTAFWLRPRPGPPLHMTAESRSQAFVAYLSYSWRSLGKTIARARNLKDVLLFLGAWFLLSDGIATVGGTAVLFAKTSLQMDTSAVALISVIVTLSGVVGAFAWSRLAGLMGLRPTQTIMTCLCLFELIPLYGLLGYIPAIQRLGVIGLQQPWEMYPLGAIYGFALGGLSSYCRSLFGELIPPGYETAFFALYAITDKGSSVFGPAIVGAITDATGEIRPVSSIQARTKRVHSANKKAGLFLSGRSGRVHFPAHGVGRCGTGEKGWLGYGYGPEARD